MMSGTLRFSPPRTLPWSIQSLLKNQSNLQAMLLYLSVASVSWKDYCFWVLALTLFWVKLHENIFTCPPYINIRNNLQYCKKKRVVDITEVKDEVVCLDTTNSLEKGWGLITGTLLIFGSKNYYNQTMIILFLFIYFLPKRNNVSL